MFSSRSRLLQPPRCVVDGHVDVGVVHVVVYLVRNLGFDVRAPPVVLAVDGRRRLGVVEHLDVTVRVVVDVVVVDGGIARVPRDPYAIATRVDVAVLDRRR